MEILNDCIVRNRVAKNLPLLREKLKKILGELKNEESFKRIYQGSKKK